MSRVQLSQMQRYGVAMPRPRARRGDAVHPAGGGFLGDVLGPVLHLLGGARQRKARKPRKPRAGASYDLLGGALLSGGAQHPRAYAAGPMGRSAYRPMHPMVSQPQGSGLLDVLGGLFGGGLSSGGARLLASPAIQDASIRDLKQLQREVRGVMRQKKGKGPRAKREPSLYNRFVQSQLPSMRAAVAMQDPQLSAVQQNRQALRLVAQMYRSGQGRQQIQFAPAMEQAQSEFQGGEEQ